MSAEHFDDRDTLNTQLAENGIQVKNRVTPVFAEILTPDALRFVAMLEKAFRNTRKTLLERRQKVQASLDSGWKPDFLPETKEIREGDWQVAPIPDDLKDRRVEITGPVTRKMVINALNSGASVYMADFEDSHAPTWAGTIDGQINVRDAINRNIDFESPEGKAYKLKDKVATLLVRPRGWHLVEKNVWVDGEPVSASIFDFALYFFHNAKTLMANGTGPYFYLPKLENHLEARLWNDVFVMAQKALDIPNGTIRATVLIETILAAFQTHEILYELRDHSAGLNCGRWDYIFSFIKAFRNHSEFVLPDRVKVNMDVHFLNSYAQLVIQSCHQHGIHAMGGMAAQIPIKNDPEANARAIEKVRQDKIREVTLGHDGTWVAHPGLVQLARDVFDENMKTPNQIDKQLTDVTITAQDLLTVPKGTITEEGLRLNVDVGLRYLESWLRGSGCVPIYNLMEDAATAEISRTQVWQWIRHPNAKLEDGRDVDAALFRKVLKEEVQKIKESMGDAVYQASQLDLATELCDAIITKDEFESFLTLKAYEHLS